MSLYDVSNPDHCNLYIGGRWVPASDGARFDVTDPATGDLIAAVASGSTDDAVAAVAAAADAAPAWAATAPRARGEILRRAFELMIENRDELAALISLESGKAWSDAQGEVTYAAEFFRWFSEEAVRATGHVQTAPNGDKRILTVLQPVGVSVLITPWNFPAAMATRKMGPALAAGCTVVLKPASDTPLTALALAVLMEQAGAPAGVVNVLPSRRSGAVAEAMLAQPATRKLSFTGSTEVGRTLLELAARNVVNCSMELGGNAPFIVFGDADVDAAVEGAMVAKMRNGGESCIAANRFIVEQSVAGEFSQKLAAAMGAMKVGPGSDRTSQVGPMINLRAAEDIASMVASSVAAGAKVLVGGTRPEGPGAYYPPTVLAGLSSDDPILDVEIFGPVAPVVAFADEDEAIALANATPFGLAAYVYTGDLARALRVSERVDAGMVGVNRGFISDPAAPFGGVKQSGLGREGGHEGLLEFLEAKYIAVDW
jgi:succinate-semialdehyde dehydrogenase/glutarate-semialdehyde dehydrogenase